MTLEGRDGMRKDKLTGDVIDFRAEVESRVITSYDSYPVPHHTEIPLNIPTKDGSEWFMEYSPAGTYPTTRWMDLDPEILGVYHSRGDTARISWEDWNQRLYDTLVDSDCVVSMRLEKTGEWLGAAVRYRGDNLQYGYTLTFQSITNRSGESRGLIQSMRKAAKLVHAEAWCRSKCIREGVIEVRVEEILWGD